ncbi:unnamed protein product [Spirodela intermedia]|uniref:Uncharacterized protein n=1 Tax=Spirodela intermedia TaxID=51605 RepID=A0ABN7EAR1_SPIIN|nr:unnamed protein product [Spirodela intermedia]
MAACALFSSYENVEIECPRYKGLMIMNDRVNPPQLIAENSWPERTPQPPTYTAHYNNYNNHNYKRGNLRTEIKRMKMLMGGNHSKLYNT